MKTKANIPESIDGKDDEGAKKSDVMIVALSKDTVVDIDENGWALYKMDELVDEIGEEEPPMEIMEGNPAQEEASNMACNPNMQTPKGH